MVSLVLRLTFFGALLCIVARLPVTAQQRACIPATEVERREKMRDVPPNEITGWVMWFVPLPVAPPECGLKGDCTKTLEDRAAIRAYLSATREFTARLPFPRFVRGVVLIFENKDTGTSWEMMRKDFGFSVQIPAGVYRVTINLPGPAQRLPTAFGAAKDARVRHTGREEPARLSLPQRTESQRPASLRRRARQDRSLPTR